MSINTENIENDKIMWYLLIHITSVLSAFIMGISGYLGRKFDLTPLVIDVNIKIKMGQNVNSAPFILAVIQHNKAVDG